MSIEKDINTHFKNEFQKTRLNIHYTHNYLSHKSNALFKEFGLSSTQFNVLRILRGQYPSATCIGLIKERMLDKSSDVSRIADRLVSKQLIFRNECPIDRRQKDIIISKKGLEILSKMDTCEKALDTQLKHLNSNELATLNKLLDKLRKSEILS